MAPYVHLGPYHDLDPLWLFLSTPDQIARLPGSQVCWTPPIHDTRDITETFQKTFTKPVIASLEKLYVHIIFYQLISVALIVG